MKRITNCVNKSTKMSIFILYLFQSLKLQNYKGHGLPQRAYTNSLYGDSFPPLEYLFDFENNMLLWKLKNYLSRKLS